MKQIGNKKIRIIYGCHRQVKKAGKKWVRRIIRHIGKQGLRNPSS